MATGPSGQSVNEALENQRTIRNAAITGLDTIDAQAQITFTLYNKVVLPFDGYVFWVRADIISPSAMFNSSPLNRFGPNAAAVIATTAQVDYVPGSLHHTTLNQQGETENFSLQKLTFTTYQPVDILTEVNPSQLWIADWGGLRFAFSARTGYYEQAGLFHYTGDAVYPTMATQVIDNVAQFDGMNIIVSNSLPIWLYLNGVFPAYPSFLVPDNIDPVYAAISIGEDDTFPLTNAPVKDRMGNHWQLVKDKVRVTIYGARNFSALDYIDYVYDYVRDNPMVMGLMNQPVVRDGKRTQTEISAIAMKKVIDFEVSYHQVRIREVAQQLITSAFINVTS